ncbi:MAG: hypothetical protein K0R27_3475 [Xanthobacteraceae bacterium]|jgi:hypothetical protein|nr:hypothetical protein [Xanthobacteraceae bacterium]
MSRNISAPFAKSRSAARLARRAVLEAGVVLSLSLAILAVACAFGIDHAAAAGLDATVGMDDGRLTMGAVLISLFAGLCVLTSFMLRDTFGPEQSADNVRPRGRQG